MKSDFEKCHLVANCCSIHSANDLLCEPLNRHPERHGYCLKPILSKNMKCVALYNTNNKKCVVHIDNELFECDSYGFIPLSKVPTLICKIEPFVWLYACFALTSNNN